MRNAPQGPGWWLASDGKWYPPWSAPAPPSPPPSPPPSQPIEVQLAKPKRPIQTRVSPWVLIVALVFFGGCIAVLAGRSDSANSATKKVHPVTYTVTYTATGSGTSTADITYDTIQEGAGQNGEVKIKAAPLPWTKTISASGLFTSYDLSVTNGPIGLSYVICTLTVDGKVVSTDKASGPFATADCSGGT